MIVPLATAAFAGVGLLSGAALLIAYSREFLPGQAIMPYLLLAEFVWVAIRVLGAPFIASNRLLLWVGLEVLFLGAEILLALWLVPRYGTVGLAEERLLWGGRLQVQMEIE